MEKSEPQDGMQWASQNHKNSPLEAAIPAFLACQCESLMS
jgi:hypothetical protein